MAGRRRVKELSWACRFEGRGLWTRNAVKGVSVRGERLKRDGGKEWRAWQPHSSKLGAGLRRARGGALGQDGVKAMLPAPGSTALYLGAGHGTSLSHLHDHMCGAQNHREGTLLAVDISPRCIRDLIRLAEVRPGLLPILADARDPHALAPFLAKRVNWLFQDVSQSGQVEMFVEMARRFLAPGGTGILSLKAASERFREGGDRAQFEAAEAALVEAGFELIEVIDLAGHEENHALFHVCAPTEGWV